MVLEIFWRDRLYHNPLADYYLYLPTCTSSAYWEYISNKVMSCIFDEFNHSQILIYITYVSIFLIETDCS